MCVPDEGGNTKIKQNAISLISPARIQESSITIGKVSMGNTSNQQVSSLCKTVLRYTAIAPDYEGGG